ncbi:putative galacturonosyltransferase 3 [Apostasia shenzhenica]|uniref:Putative galacturonosyltransferase 3 n=1 Tax=Apostasia shenzhenica TaxID=1088818 RepID=A0A2H9ZSD1_9ASPA|nr:putative galacturonosyltransferase 3 [Apostasia shenzhenica]
MERGPLPASHFSVPEIFLSPRLSLSLSLLEALAAMATRSRSFSSCGIPLLVLTLTVRDPFLSLYSLSVLLFFYILFRHGCYCPTFPMSYLHALAAAFGAHDIKRRRLASFHGEGSKSDQTDEGVGITLVYTDISGRVGIHSMNSKDLSSSWVWKYPDDTKHAPAKAKADGSSQLKSEDAVDTHAKQIQLTHSITPLKLKRQKLRQRRREKRIAELINMSKEAELELRAAAIKRSKELNVTSKGRYSIWRREYQNPNSDSTLKLMKDQVIMAKIYANIARSVKRTDLYDSLLKHIRESQHAIGDAITDADLQQHGLECAKAMGHALAIAKDVLYDCNVVERKLRVMIQSSESSISAARKQSTFLTQHAAKTVPRPLNCLPLQLTTDYYLHGHTSKVLSDKSKLEDPSLYHYAIFSDNVLAASVVVNSTVTHAKEPEKHVFHIVTDRLNFAAMRMWFIAHHPSPATIEVQNINEFKWLNSSYCSVLRQLESARIKEYYFRANHPSSLSTENENLKYRNPKYLSMLNHLRFYMPEVYPKLDKILFLDDDIVIQKDLTPLWSIDMKGMVNGAVETCKESFHRFDTYLNFSNPMISNNFDPQACGWAFGMNIFDLKEWKRRNITGIYHYWQDSNEDRTLWKLGTLPPGLITFYNLTHPLDRSWHVLGLGYDPAVKLSLIENAAVIHYNGNYKPWLDLAITKYKSYWSKFVNSNDRYIQVCSLSR